MVKGKIKVRDEKTTNYKFSLEGVGAIYYVESRFTNRERMYNTLGVEEESRHGGMSHDFYFAEEDAPLLIELLTDFIAYRDQYRKEFE